MAESTCTIISIGKLRTYALEDVEWCILYIIMRMRRIGEYKFQQARGYRFKSKSSMWDSLFMGQRWRAKDKYFVS